MERDTNDRVDEETDEQKAAKEYYERSVELERLRCKYYYSTFILLAYDINCTFLYRSEEKEAALSPWPVENYLFVTAEHHIGFRKASSFS